MEYASILVHVADGTHRKPVITSALDLGHIFGADVTGLYLEMPRLPGGYSRDVHRQLPDEIADEEAAERNAELKAEFATHAARHGVIQHHWHYQPNPRARPLLADVMAQHARCADLVVIGQYDPEDEIGHTGYDNPAHIALLSARPTLVIPRAHALKASGAHVVLAWNGSREATRAVTAALPILTRARTVDIVIVDDDKALSLGEDDVPGADIARYLAFHGISSSIVCPKRSRASVTEVLLATLADHDADLLCMGAYGHSRLREMVLGGVTFDILRRLVVPTLLVG